MNDDKNDSIAKSLETHKGMLQYMPKLLEDLWDMGCSLQTILKLVEPLNLPIDETKILDLGCGKGAAGLTLADKFGFSLVGVDASEDFLNSAISKASEMGLTDRSNFILQDIRESVKKESYYDLVIYASLGNILGNFDQIVQSLRNVIKTGGYIIIDDGYLKNNESVDRAGYGHYRSYNSTIQLLLSHGDKLISEMSTDEETLGINNEYLRLIKIRAKEIIEKNPDAETMIAEYIRGQEEECKFIDENVSGAAWLLQKA
ncbi:SAM-dependent methyltransferase [Bacteroidota bacterium]